MTKQAGDSGIEDLRARRDQIDRQLAQATIEPMEAFTALLGSDEVVKILDRVTTAAEPLDEATRGRIEQWTKLHAALAKLAEHELARLRKLID